MASETTMSGLFLKKLQNIGSEMIKFINHKNGSEENQYMVAYLVTDEELNSRNIKPLYIIEDQFLRLIENPDIQIRDKYFQFDRFIFLMNLYDKNGKSYQHTENRLLDGKGTFSDPQSNVTEDGGFLTKLKSDFKRINGDIPYTILIFTYYIPCTQEKHQCAKLIKQYADSTGCKLTIGWAVKYETTDVEEAHDLMRSENVSDLQLCGTPQAQWGPVRFQPHMAAIQTCHSPYHSGEHDVNRMYPYSCNPGPPLIWRGYDFPQQRYYDVYHRNHNNFPQNNEIYKYRRTQNRSRF